MRVAVAPELLRVTPKGVRLLESTLAVTPAGALVDVRLRPSLARLDRLLLELDRRLDGAAFTVARDCRFDLGRDARLDATHERFTVPAGFRTDLASVGRPGLLVCAVFGVDPLALAEAAVAHDWLRHLAGRDRRLLRQADEAFRRVLELTSGLSQEEVDVVYLAVRGHAHSLVYSRAWQILADKAPDVALFLLRRYAL